MSLKKDQEAYMKAWAEMMITIWKDCMRKERVRSSNQLYNSFKYEVVKLPNGKITKINHAFKRYGIYPALGVGSGVTFKDQQRGFGGRRKSKDWFFDQYDTSAWVLRIKIAEIYGEFFRGSITAILED